MNAPRRVLAGTVALLPLLGLAAFFALRVDRNVSFEALAALRADLSALVLAHPLLAPPGFVALQACAVALGWPVVAVLSALAGLLFGPLLGTCYAVAGSSLGAAASFALARTGLLRGQEVSLGSSLAPLLGSVRRNAFTAVLLLRLTPMAPSWAVNLGAGLLGVPFRPFLAATVLGSVPLAALYASLGQGLGSLLGEGRPLTAATLMAPALLGPLLAAVALALLPVALAGVRRWRGKRAHHL